MENNAGTHRKLLNGSAAYPQQAALHQADAAGLDADDGEFDRLVRFLDESPDPILRVARGGVVTYANHSGQILLMLWQEASSQGCVPLWHDLLDIALDSGSRIDKEVDVAGRTYMLAFIPGAETGAAYIHGRDITETRGANDALQRRDAILQAVAVSAEKFLGGGDWQEQIGEVLQGLGLATEASRIYIYENRITPQGDRVLGLRHRWIAETMQRSTHDLEVLALAGHGLARWEGVLEHGSSISGSIGTFPAEERGTLAAWWIRSILVIPIFIGDRWWGVLGFDVCQSDHEWDLREVEALKTAARILGSAIQHTQAQEDLQRQREFTRLVIDTDPNLIYVKDASGRFVLANQATADLYGTTAEEIVGLNNWNLHSVPEEVMCYQQSDREVLGGLREVAVREQYTRPDGSILWFETVKKPLAQPDGVVHVLGISNDITERRRAELVLRNREQQQAAVARLGLQALASARVVDLMDSALNTVREMLGVDLAAIWEVLPDGSGLRMCAGVGWSQGTVGSAMVGLETESPAGFVLRSNAPVVVADWQTEHRFTQPEVIAAHGVCSSANVLIHGKKQPFGVMSAHVTVPRSFTEDDINFLQAVANVLAYAIEWKQAEKALRESEERYRIAAETATDAILTVDQDNRIIFANQSAETIFGYAMPEVLWQDLRLLLSDSIEQIRRQAEQEIGGRPNCRSVALQGRHKTGALLPLEVSVGEFVKNGRGYFTCIIRDITERKRAEENINTLNDELRQANALLTVERDRQKKHVAVLEELNLMKSEFVSSVSHELRTPLASIIGFAQTILIDPDLPVDMRQEFLQIVLEEGKRLAKLINDLLDLARIESGRVVLENTRGDVVPLVKRALQSILMQAEAKSIAVKTTFDQDSIMAVFDIDRMMQVVINLLSNAVKFTPDGGKVEVRAGVEGSDVVIDVADTGLGIPADDIPRLFDKFFRVHRPGLDIRGTGLGLAIAKHAVELQQGTLTVQSEQNNGSIFTIRFPQ